MKNAELMAIPAVAEAIKAGKVVCIDKKPTDNPNYVQLYLFAEVEGLGGGSGEMSEASAMFLGFSGSQSRCIQNASKDFAENVEIGQTFDGLTFRCVDTVKPEWQGHSPRADSSGQIFFNEGKEIYRRFELVTKDEFKKLGHTLLKVTTKGVQEAPKGVPADNVLEQ
jgi:hypothetical protein